MDSLEHGCCVCVHGVLKCVYEAVYGVFMCTYEGPLTRLEESSPKLETGSQDIKPSH